MSALTTLETDLDCVGDVCVKDDGFVLVSFFLFEKMRNYSSRESDFFIRIQPLFFTYLSIAFSIDDIDRAAFDGRNVEANTRESRVSSRSSSFDPSFGDRFPAPRAEPLRPVLEFHWIRDTHPPHRARKQIRRSRALGGKKKRKNGTTKTTTSKKRALRRT